MNKVTEKEQFFLDNVPVDGRSFGALNRISQRIGMGCEPTVEVVSVGDGLANQLVALGLLEEGPADDPWPDRGYPHGYKVTQLGWKIIQRGSDPGVRG